VYFIDSFIDSFIDGLIDSLLKRSGAGRVTNNKRED